ncbi:PP2C family protein-serine/threonine phosphatase [Virgibacillus halophilus]|uniref:Protein phosphatase 2C domain-containing protein n=1 Tax=Tigheibacillus halophilus TaxID=361280 RepID=A0ABU5C714_9BACI|nr:protein phosphatase 2C domain-containing protein [Virgibacillus halophilus]
MTEKKKLHIGQKTVQGPDKEINDDYMDVEICHIHQESDAYLLVIADGMGGHAFGDIASFYAVNRLQKWWKKTSLHCHTPEAFLQRCKEEMPKLFQSINKKLIAIGQAEEKGTGTTMTALMLVEGNYFICHIGDCRVYQLHSASTNGVYSDDTVDLTMEKKDFVQLTKDHSWANMQIEHGALTPEEAKGHPKAHVLTQCLGIRGDVRPYTATGTFRESDHFLLCTDGFYALFDDGLIQRQWMEQLQASASETEMAAHFLQLAKKGKHHDDVSILLANLR